MFNVEEWISERKTDNKIQNHQPFVDDFFIKNKNIKLKTIKYTSFLHTKKHIFADFKKIIIKNQKFIKKNIKKNAKPHQTKKKSNSKIQIIE